jgi:hypothetical protein
MAPFGSFVDLLAEIEDPRRAEGKLYRLPARRAVCDLGNRCRR